MLSYIYKEEKVKKNKYVVYIYSKGIVLAENILKCT